MLVYHRTSLEAKRAILANGFVRKNYPWIYVSNMRDGFYGYDYGPEVVTLNVPEEILIPDCGYRTGEKFYRINFKDIKPEYIIKD